MFYWVFTRRQTLKMDLTEGSETSAKHSMTSEKHPKEHIQDSEYGENWKSRIIHIYLTATGLTPGGSSTSHIYTQTVYTIQRKENWEVRAMPRLCELCLGICLTTEEKEGKPWVRVAQYKNNEAQYKKIKLNTRNEAQYKTYDENTS
jgi:hypothetical protein